MRWTCAAVRRVRGRSGCATRCVGRRAWRTGSARRRAACGCGRRAHRPPGGRESRHRPTAPVQPAARGCWCCCTLRQRRPRRSARQRAEASSGPSEHHETRSAAAASHSTFFTTHSLASATTASPRTSAPRCPAPTAAHRAPLLCRRCCACASTSRLAPAARLACPPCCPRLPPAPRRASQRPQP
jgi:hypothetical protein